MNISRTFRNTPQERERKREREQKILKVIRNHPIFTKLRFWKPGHSIHTPMLVADNKFCINHVASTPKKLINITKILLVIATTKFYMASFAS